MALHGQALGHRLLLGVPQENARHRPLFLCESENWPNEVLVDPVARAGIAAQPSRGRGDQQVLDRAPAGRVVLLVSNFFSSPTMETMITTGDEKHLARAKLRASSLACSPFFSTAQRTAACRAPTKSSRPSPENTWKRQGWVNLWLGAQWAASSNSSIHCRGISVGRYSFTERRVLIAVSASARGRSVVIVR
jgi:hypothetical protein